MPRLILVSSATLSLAALACGPAPKPADAGHPEGPAGTVLAVVDTVIPAVFEASGTARPFAEATLSTKLMGTVTAVLALEGQRVERDAPIVRIDAADLQAKDAQVAAQVAAAEASLVDASATATRIRALYADSAAPRAQLDAAEAGLARAKAGVAAATAGRAEVSAASSYGTVRAPFAGIVTRRFVDPGAFAAPGAPLVTVQDVSRLRIIATIPAAYAAAVRRGTTLRARIEGADARAAVEGVVPAPGATFSVNAIVANPGERIPSGGAAVIEIATGASERVLLVPDRAVVREGDLTGVRVMHAGRAELRWVRIGRAAGGRTRVLTGLAAGDSVVVPPVGR